MRRPEIVGATLLLVAWSALAGAQPLQAQQTSPTGLTSLRVEVQLIGEAARMGLTEDSVSRAVGERLRGSGLEVTERSDATVRGDPRLRVAVQAVNAAGGYAFLVSVQLVERVINYRRYVELVFDGVLPTGPTDSVVPLEIAAGIKWEGQALGTTSRENSLNSIPNAVLDYVDRFLEDYRTANRR